HSRVDDHRASITEVMAPNLDLGRVDICGGLTACKYRPEKQRRCPGYSSIIGQDQQGPVLKFLPLGKALSLFRIFRILQARYDQASRTKDLYFMHIAGNLPLKNSRKLPDRLTQAKENCFASLVDLRTTVIQGIHGKVRNDEQVRFPTNTLENVFEQFAEISQVDHDVGYHQEFRKGKLTLSQDPEGRGHGLTLITLLPHRRRKAM